MQLKKDATTATASSSSSSSSLRSLSLEASNEYGVFDALALYGLDMVVEPHKKTTLSAFVATGRTTTAPGGGGGWDNTATEEKGRGDGGGQKRVSTVSTEGGGGEGRENKQTEVIETAQKTWFRWVLTPLDEGGAPVPGAPPMLNVTLLSGGGGDGGSAEGFMGGLGGSAEGFEGGDGGGAGVFGGRDGVGGSGSGSGGGRIAGPTITLTEGGSLYLLVVTEMLEDGRVVGEGRATVSCRYVRRELRDLTVEDREAFMDAMVRFYTAPTVSESDGLDELNYQHFAAVHNAEVRVGMRI